MQRFANPNLKPESEYYRKIVARKGTGLKKITIGFNIFSILTHKKIVRFCLKNSITSSHRKLNKKI